MSDLLYDDCLDWNHTPLGPRNHNKNTTSVHYRRLALQRNRAMYIAAFVFGDDVDSYFLRTLENAADK